MKLGNSLTIIHHDIRGLRDKIDELICSQTSNNINRYICVSEHYATEQNLLTLNLENYGSCVFVKCHLQFNTFDVTNFGLEKICEICAV